MITMLLLGPHSHESADVEAHRSFIQTLFEAAGVWAPVTLGGLAIAIVVNLVQLIRNFNRTVNGVALAEQLKKLVAAGNIERALKLCHAAEGAVATQVAVIGLNAQMRKEDGYAAMIDARTRILNALRTVHVVALVLGVGALLESAVMVAEAVSKGFPGDEIGAIVVFPALLVCLVVANVMRWSGMQRDMDAVIAALR